MHPIASHPNESQLSEYLLGKLSDLETSNMECHLAGCEECLAAVQCLQPRDSLMELLAEAARSKFNLRTENDSVAATLHAEKVSTSVCGALTDADSDRSLEPAEGIAAELVNHKRYRVIRLLGRGGMGCVWLAEHLVLGRLVALKMLRGDWLQKPNAMERFDREIRAAAKFSHPNVATVHDAERIGDSHFLVMEYVQGETLEQIVSRGPLSVGDACRAIRDAAAGLAHAHEARLIHRDVKPGNMIRATSGEVKILDFGLVVSTGDTSSLTGQNLVMGTPDYISPEQAEDPRQADERSDIYSLGCTFYHLLAGQVPYPDRTVVKKIDAHRTTSPPEIAGLSAIVSSIMAKMMHRNPEERFQNANDIDRALSDALCSPTLNIRLDGEPNPDVRACSNRSRRRSWQMFAACGILLAALLSGGLYFMPSSTGELVIETKESNVKVVVKQHGKVVVVIDTKTDNRWRLKAGVYELDVLRHPNSIDDSQLLIDSRTVEMKRNAVVVATVTKRRPGSTVDLTNSIEALGTTADHGYSADGLLRFALLTPSALGVGTAENYSVMSNVLKMDTMRSPQEVWLNYAYVASTEARFQAQVRFLKCNEDVEEIFVKIALLSFIDNGEYDVEIWRKSQTVIARICNWRNGQRTYIDVSDPFKLPDGEWAALNVQWTSSKLEVSIDGSVAATYTGSVPGPRYPAIAAKNCIAELQNPEVIIKE